MGLVVVNDDNFESEVLKSNKKVLVDFNADWCNPCRMLSPIIDELASEREDIKVVSINVDNAENVSSEYGIMSIPCLVIFENGKEVKRSVGFINKSEIEEMIGE